MWRGEKLALSANTPRPYELFLIQATDINVGLLSHWWMLMGLPAQHIGIWLSASPLYCFAALMMDQRPLLWAVPEAGRTPAVNHRGILPNQNGSHVRSQTCLKYTQKVQSWMVQIQWHLTINTDYHVLFLEYFQIKYPAWYQPLFIGFFWLAFHKPFWNSVSKQKTNP